MPFKNDPDPSKLKKTAASKQQIHQLADKKGIPWDDDPKFKKWSKKVTGKAHLDDMSPSQLSRLKKALKERGMKKEATNTIMDKMEKIASAWRTYVRAGRLSPESLARLKSTNRLASRPAPLSQRLQEYKRAKSSGMGREQALQKTKEIKQQGTFEPILDPRREVAGLKRGNKALMKAHNFAPYGRLPADMRKQQQALKTRLLAKHKDKLISESGPWFTRYNRGTINRDMMWSSTAPKQRTPGNMFSPKLRSASTMQPTSWTVKPSRGWVSGGREMGKKEGITNSASGRLGRAGEAALSTRHEILENIVARRNASKIKETPWDKQNRINRLNMHKDDVAKGWVDDWGLKKIRELSNAPPKRKIMDETRYYSHMSPEVLQREAGHANFMPTSTRRGFAHRRAQSGEALQMADALGLPGRGASSGVTNVVSDAYRKLYHPDPRVRKKLVERLQRHYNRGVMDVGGSPKEYALSTTPSGDVGRNILDKIRGK